MIADDTVRRTVLNRLLSMGGAAFAGLSVVAAVIAYRWYNQTPPPLQSVGPGTVRLKAPASSGARAPFSEVTLADGGSVSLEFVFAQESPRAATVLLATAPTSTVTLQLREGERQTAGNVSVRLLHVWTEPKLSHEAIDVQVTGRR